jgi:hypothetical protein
MSARNGDLAFCATYGAQAVEHGSPDYHENDDHTNVVDVLANIMHYCAEDVPGDGAIDFDAALESARRHFDAERAGVET